MQKIAQKLLYWYDRHHRELPWRTPPQAQQRGVKADPYHVWLSEIMLQQTTVEAVKPYFAKFLQKWPRLESLSKASEEDVLKAWAGLGYYSRARNLKACATRVINDHQGQFPADFQALKKLPGIGDYTAAAICSIAFDQPVAVVDGNVERVISRLFTIKTPLPEAKAEIRQKTQSLTPINRPGDFAQSMMDLGATLCTPKRPSCILCPIHDGCLALLQSEPENFPVKAPKKERPERHGAAFIALSKTGKIFLKKRPPRGLLASMTEVPNHFSAQLKTTSAAMVPCQAAWQKCGQAQHIFTHFALTLDIYYAKNIDEKTLSNGFWCALEELHHEALPTVMKKAIAVALPDIFKV